MKVQLFFGFHTLLFFYAVHDFKKPMFLRENLWRFMYFERKYVRNILKQMFKYIFVWVRFILFILFYHS